MKKFLNTVVAGVATLLLICGCSPEPPKRISRVGDIAMGDEIRPRNGEGELLNVSGSLPGGFDRMQVEVTPFEHRVFRMVFEAVEVNGSSNPLDSCAAVLEKEFNIKFVRTNADLFRVELPGTEVLLRRGFYLGPRGVVLEIIDRELAGQAGNLKNSPRFRQHQKCYQARNRIILLAHCIAGFRLDTGTFPEKLNDLIERPAGCPTWNGPYCQQLPSAAVVYRRVSADSYELYCEIDGKRIKEDTEL